VSDRHEGEGYALCHRWCWRDWRRAGGTIGEGGLCRHLHHNSLLLDLSTAMAVAREQPGKYTVQQLWERLQE
jgi:hypothetical protein